MVSHTISVYASSDGRRFTRSYHTPYSYMPERRFQVHHHDSRIMTMTDAEVESDPSQQRKRISVAVSSVRLRPFHTKGYLFAWSWTAALKRADQSDLIWSISAMVTDSSRATTVWKVS